MTTTIFDYTVRNGGGTFDASTLRPIESSDLTAQARPYVVGGADGVGERRFSVDTPSTPRCVDLYVSDLAHSGVAEIGTWIFDGCVYVDAVERFRSRGLALETAHDLGELAIFDLARGEEITVEGKVSV